jgi:hypothetical protein
MANHEMTNTLLDKFIEDLGGAKLCAKILKRAKDELLDRDVSFELRWCADKRAIRAWQEAHPERGEVWPDHADLVLWLMERLAGQEGERAAHAVRAGCRSRLIAKRYEHAIEYKCPLCSKGEDRPT